VKSRDNYIDFHKVFQNIRDMKLEYDIDLSFSAQNLELIFALKSRPSGKKMS
jgi:hypothetical protein